MQISVSVCQWIDIHQKYTILKNVLAILVANFSQVLFNSLHTHRVHSSVKIAAAASIDGGSGSRWINNLFNRSYSTQLNNKTKLQKLYQTKKSIKVNNIYKIHWTWILRTNFKDDIITVRSYITDSYFFIFVCEA